MSDCEVASYLHAVSIELIMKLTLVLLDGLELLSSWFGSYVCGYVEMYVLVSYMLIHLKLLDFN